MRHAAAFRLEFVEGDVADADLVRRQVERCDLVVHLAAQVSVVGAMRDPGADFRSNVVGTVNVLEAARAVRHRPIVLYSSTNKVYGSLSHLAAVECETRWILPDRPVGIAETEPIDLVTPYACSKGAADLYALDFARTFGVRAVVFRQSCIYGPHQHGDEEQAWAAWFIKAVLGEHPITIFGDGKQVRDLLHVQDLLDAYNRAVERIDVVAGSAFNVGGGVENVLSIGNEFFDILGSMTGRRVPLRYEVERPGDQKVFFSDNRLAERVLGWQPAISVREGLEELLGWLGRHRVGRAIE